MAFLYWIRHPNHTDILSQGYVGVTERKVSRRFNQHVCNSNNGGNLPINCAIRKYDRSKLIVETIVIGDVDYVYDIERKLRPTAQIGWNFAGGGDRSGIGRAQKPLTKEHRLKLSNSLKGRVFSEDHKLAISEARKKEWNAKPKHVGCATNTNHEVWALAEKLHKDYVSGMSVPKMCTKYGIEKPSKIHSMVYVHFKKGWIPQLDESWISKYGNLQ